MGSGICWVGEKRENVSELIMAKPDKSFTGQILLFHQMP